MKFAFDDHVKQRVMDEERESRKLWPVNNTQSSRINIKKQWYELELCVYTFMRIAVGINIIRFEDFTIYKKTREKGEGERERKGEKDSKKK